MSTLHVIVPQGIDDPAEPSGGNVYDRRVCRALAAGGWHVRERDVQGPWPAPDAVALGALSHVLEGIDDGSVVLVDGLIASAAGQVLVPASDRLRLVVLVHAPLGLGLGPDDPPRTDERAVLEAADAVVATSRWTRQWLLDAYQLPAARLHVAEPGVERADLAPGTVTGGHLLCVGAVTPAKGQDVLVAALAELAELPWSCLCVGPVTRNRRFALQVDEQVQALGLGGRVRFAGPRTGADLDAAYAAADVLVLPSRSETYGMVVTEALAHGLPVIATDAGGTGEALGQAADGRRPGLLVPADDPASLAQALRTWLADPAARLRLRHLARERRSGLRSWSQTCDQLAHVLGQVAA